MSYTFQQIPSAELLLSGEIGPLTQAQVDEIFEAQGEITRLSNMGTPGYVKPVYLSELEGATPYGTPRMPRLPGTDIPSLSLGFTGGFGTALILALIVVTQL